MNGTPTPEVIGIGALGVAFIYALTKFFSSYSKLSNKMLDTIEKNTESNQHLANLVEKSTQKDDVFMRALLENLKQK